MRDFGKGFILAYIVVGLILGIIESFLDSPEDKHGNNYQSTENHQKKLTTNQVFQECLKNSQAHDHESIDSCFSSANNIAR